MSFCVGQRTPYKRKNASFSRSNPTISAHFAKKRKTLESFNIKQEKEEDLNSIQPFLPLVLSSSKLIWPPGVIEVLEALSKGPVHSRVFSGVEFFHTITGIRKSLSLPYPNLASAHEGCELFFDKLMPRPQSEKWFQEVVPALANLLLRLPSLIETHYQEFGEFGAGLRILVPQEGGAVFLSQELIGALLSCSFFCLFPTTRRGAERLPRINFNRLFALLHDSYSKMLEQKLYCIVHYFERITTSMPTGFVSFERKVLPLGHSRIQISYPKIGFWSKSIDPLCVFHVCKSGSRDLSSKADRVDFGHRCFGGGALGRGCVQEEVLFMINPELIAGMLFLPSMSDNEAIEIVGAEKFSYHKGYGSSFHFSGAFVDDREQDFMGRRKTRIISIDALSNPGMKQYKLDFLLREINKAFCGFLEQSPDLVVNSERLARQDKFGIKTGNWGCGAFRGDPELKTIIQWLAASKASRPFILYDTCGRKELQNLDQASEGIIKQGWTVGQLWDKLVEYSYQRFKGKICLSLFAWLLSSSSIC